MSVLRPPWLVLIAYEGYLYRIRVHVKRKDALGYTFISGPEIGRGYHTLTQVSNLGTILRYAVSDNVYNQKCPILLHGKIKRYPFSVDSRCDVILGR
jgi:hypothetical protein